MTSQTVGSVTFDLNAFASISVNSLKASGLITLVSGAPNLFSSQQLGLQSKVYGPFGVPCEVTITVTSGIVDYVVVENPYGDSSSGTGGVFRGAYTWDARPTSDLTVGDTLRASDVGAAPGTMFVWTGSRWRRMFPFTLAEFAGSVAAPLASLGTGITAGTFTLPSVPTIPENLLEAADAVMIDALVTHIGTGGTSDFNVHLGTAGTTSDSLAVSRNITAVANRTFHARTEVSFSSLTNFVSAAGVPTNDQTTSTLVDRTTNVNLAAAMYTTVAIAAGNAADSWKLIWFRLLVL